MGKVHYDTAALATQMRAERERMLATALAAADDDDGRAFAFAQDALLETRISVMQICIDLKGAGRSDDFIGQLFGLFFRELSSNLMLIATDKAAMARGFNIQADPDAPRLAQNVFTARPVRGGSA